MPSINDIIDTLRPVINDALAEAYLQGQRDMLRHLDRALDHDADVRLWHDANVMLLDAVETIPVLDPDLEAKDWMQSQ